MEGLEKRYRLTRAIGSRFTGGYRLRREPVLRSSTSVFPLCLLCAEMEKYRCPCSGPARITSSCSSLRRKSDAA